MLRYVHSTSDQTAHHITNPCPLIYLGGKLYRKKMVYLEIYPIHYKTTYDPLRRLEGRQRNLFFYSISAAQSNSWMLIFIFIFILNLYNT